MMSCPWLLLVLLLPAVAFLIPDQSSQTKEERDLSNFLKEQLALMSRKEYPADDSKKHLEMTNRDQHNTDSGYNSLLAIIRDYVDEEKRALPVHISWRRQQALQTSPNQNLRRQ
ncbi:uncharacterized protein LOC112564920 isoform X2 [Pomacea canaliculata]|nr:uncharacterized protein LOC112564920 isoform X2 [Pomacea canaliculata]XP_025095845.1 uncharacterized protein LOC112564920 isoform X2 [Pomacea canaliculata]